MAKPTTEQLAMINQKTLVPLTEDETYTFPAKLVGDNVIPGRFYRITPNALTKMAAQAKQGVSLLLDHSWANLGIMTIPIGRTYDSRLQQDGGELALYADHYMKMGQEINDISTDQIASGIDAGTIFDTSIGFMSLKSLCSICGNNYFSSDCMHLRGKFYDDNKLCIVDIDDADLMENSLVFDGAYPGAGVVGLNKSGGVGTSTQWDVLTEDAKSLNGDGRIFFSFSNKSGFTGFVPKQIKQETQETPETQSKGDEGMTEAEKQAQLALEQTQKSALGVATGLLTQIRTALGVTGDDGILAKITALSSQAADGEKYKTSLIEETCGAGVRALDKAFNVEIMKTSLANLPVAEIEKIRDQYNTQAKAVLGAGGRQTVGNESDLPADPNVNLQNQTEKTVEEKQAQAKTDARAALDRTGNGNIMKEVK